MLCAGPGKGFIAIGAQAATEDAMLNRRHKILVVDDERTIVSACTTILESQGYETAAAYSGEEAVQMASSFHPDCIVSDIMMGVMNGVEAAIEISGVLPQCRVLFISGNAGYGDLLEKARAKGFHFELMLKPVPPAELLAKLSQILAAGRQNEELTGLRL